MTTLNVHEHKDQKINTNRQPIFVDGCSLQGHRPYLEDTWISLSRSSPEGTCSIVGVFDGVGGSEGGQVASAAAAQSIARSLGEMNSTDFDHTSSPDLLEHWLSKALINASWAVSQAGPGATTAVVAMVRETHEGHRVTLAWVGDSRAYLISNDHSQIHQLTDDHSVEDAPGQPLSRWLGRFASPPDSHTHQLHTPDVRTFTIAPGDTLMITTDGVHGVFHEDELLAVFREANSSANTSSASEYICQEALDYFSMDNCTCLLATGSNNTSGEETAHV